MKILIVFLTVCLGVLQYKLWLGDDSRRELKEVEAVEEGARSELGMIEDGETFYLIVPNR